VNLAVASSSLTTSLHRYGRSTGLWILLLIAPVGARFMIAARGDDHALVSVNGQVPWLTSQTLGMAVGVVIATLLMPAAFIYLRANVNKRQPWQVEEVSPASRAAMMFGRWLADVAVLAAVLTATSAAACLLALFMLPLREVNLAHVIIPIWAIAAPPLAMTASLRILFDARRWTRGWLGEVLFFIFWMASLVLIAAGDKSTGFAANMLDLPGFMSPLSYARGGLDNFTIGGGEITPGSPPIVLDIMSGVFAPGYLAARLTWLVVTAMIPLIAGLIYAPHVAGRARRPARWLKMLQPGKAPPADPAAPPARPAFIAWLGVLTSEARLIASGRLMMLAMGAVALAGAFVPWSAVAAPAVMLLLVFGATAHAGRSEQAGLLALTRTGLVTPMARRAAFVCAGALLAVIMSAGAIAQALIRGELRPLVEAPLMGAATALAAIGLGAATRSATAPRLVLLIAWYGYLNWGGGTPPG
jgi:hypothetical protein